MSLVPTFGEHTINELTLMFRSRQINLEPGFQRRSVWTLTDRRRLIESIVGGYPVPSVFLYRRDRNGGPVYDVIDGKQRLETIFMFTKVGRFKRDWFEVKLDLGNGRDWYDWSTLKRSFSEQQAALVSYKLQTVEVTGELNQIIDLFVKINSTGKRLTSGERRHAKYYTSPFLREADRLVIRFRRYLEDTRILSAAQIDRMKGTELFAELLMSINNGGPINKKTSLDRAIGNDTVNAHTLGKLSREFTRSMNLVRRMFPNLKQVRFRNSAEFYSLILLIWEMEQAGFILTERRRNRIAFELLKRLSTGVDELRDQLRRAKPARTGQRIFSDYLLTVQGDTDSSANRERRREILKGLLWTLFERKDANRTFSPEQRRIIWHNDEKKKCVRCGKYLTWREFTVDHVKAWARGGQTSLRNANPMHRGCNSSKGARAA
ncbi:MAG TPA: DUF262 domain-containing protein [Candidatus Dormibacteraeota bacterium]|nr:DUF262 domain-containing protein [Candidatus Dormibacteraeota bacterium]